MRQSNADSTMQGTSLRTRVPAEEPNGVKLPPILLLQPFGASSHTYYLHNSIKEAPT